MNPKKQKAKNRRRARALAEEAWEAANGGNLDLAEKIIRRAVATQEDNPVLWNDQGLILGLRQKHSEAARSFMAALSLTPTFADAYANLAALRLRQGSVEEALVLQEQAVKYAPHNAPYAEQFQAYQALAGQGSDTFSPVLPVTASSPTDANQPIPAEKVSVPLPASDWNQQLGTLDWHTLGSRLARDGYVVISGLVDAPTCEWLRGLFDDEQLFAKTIVMDRPEFGNGVYRYFSAPVPKAVDQLRRAVYPRVAEIANEWQKMLGESERFPQEWETFRDQCHQAGQTIETPILLKYGPGGFNALHRDLRGAMYFPIQMAVVLSPHADAGDTGPRLSSSLACIPGTAKDEGEEPPTHRSQAHGFQGGEFLFCDSGEGRKARRREIPLGLGDAVLFCTRDRLVRTGGMVGLQPVKHGAGLVTSGIRFVLGVPFHVYR